MRNLLKMGTLKMQKANRGKTFVLGLGHQRCGTSWLHSYLRKNSEFQSGHTKEWHIWDVLDSPVIRAERFPDGLGRGFPIRPTAIWRRSAYRDPMLYFSYVNTLFSRGQFVGDITPSYSVLDADRLSFIREELLALGANIKILIAVRRPVDRIISAVNYNIKKRNRAREIRSISSSYEDIICEYYKSDGCRLRTEYQHAINNARKIFKAEEIYITSYEKMFSGREIKRFSEFFNTRNVKEYQKVKVNRSGKAPKISQSLVRDMEKSYIETKNYICSNGYADW